MSNPTLLATVDKAAQERADFARSDEIKITRVASGFVLSGAMPPNRIGWPVKVAYDAADLGTIVENWGNQNPT